MIEPQQIILATIEDIPAITDICKDYWGENGAYSEEAYKKLIEQKLSYTLQDNGELIGFCLCNERSSALLNIASLAVKRGYTGRGLGKRLLSYCIDNGISEGYTMFSLHVEVDNVNAFKLYSGLDFKIRRTIRNYYTQEKKDAYFMMKFVKSLN